MELTLCRAPLLCQAPHLSPPAPIETAGLVWVQSPVSVQVHRESWGGSPCRDGNPLGSAGSFTATVPGAKGNGDASAVKPPPGLPRAALTGPGGAELSPPARLG